MAEAHVTYALRDKRSEPAGMGDPPGAGAGWTSRQTHLDATMRLFDPDLRPEEIRPRHQPARNAWFRPDEAGHLFQPIWESQLWVRSLARSTP